MARAKPGPAQKRLILNVVTVMTYTRGAIRATDLEQGNHV